MKKLTVTILSVLMAMTLLTACGGKKEEEPVSYDLAAVYQGLLDLQEDPDSLVFFESTNYFDRFYIGLSDIELKQQVLYCPPITGFACEVAMVECANAEDVDAVKAIFQARIDSGASGEACDAEVGEIWKNRAEIQVSGNYVAMVVLPEENTMPENIFLGK